MSNEGLSKDLMQCACASWARTDGEWSGHNTKCPMHPEALIRDAAQAMLEWGAEEDGVHPDQWPVYQRLVLAVTGTMPHCCNRCDAALPQGEGPGTCDRCVAEAAERDRRHDKNAEAWVRIDLRAERMDAETLAGRAVPFGFDGATIKGAVQRLIARGEVEVATDRTLGLRVKAPAARDPALDGDAKTTSVPREDFSHTEGGR